MAALQERGIVPIDLVAVNLYPFQRTISRPGVSFEDAVENIDIGGPSMLRSAAKNHESVLPVVDPTDYPKVLDLLRGNGLTPAVRREFAAKVFAHTADYDAAIAGYLTPPEEGLPRRLGIAMERTQALRYGENPAQRAALYVTEEPRGVRDLTQRQGKELSFNNLLDIDAAMASVACWSTRPACSVIKHTTPSGIAVATSAVDAFRKARATDPVSAFGSVIAFNTVVDRATAQAMSDLFVEVVVAPSFHDEAMAVLAAKKALRVVELPVSKGTGSLDYKRVRGGFLVQDQFQFDPSDQEWAVATDRQPTEREWNDLRFAWAAVASVKSNAILLAREEAAIGIGAGQMSRVDSVFLAVHKARQAGHDPAGSVLASDGFIPFADNIELAAGAGIAAVIQPGGSVRDPEVVEAANRHGLAMVMTGRRQFRH
jgi:phosphoribosylaminoimidazolecarboxamide formyltransferase/IMP cyclohydrolase